MDKKVRLPKEVCDALDYAINECAKKKPNIVAITLGRNWYSTHKEFCVLNQQDPEVIMRALVLGYEPELTAEEQLKVYFQSPSLVRSGTYRGGVIDALRTHGIYYEWLEPEDAE